MPAKTRNRTKATPVTVSDLTPNEANPRKPWTDPQREAFQKSLAEFGDLSGIVFNITTGHLVGGHKRVDEFRDGNPAIEKQVLAVPDSAGTVAVGRVMINGTSFAYREVKWSKEKEAAATLAANKWGAEWDWGGVKDMLTLIQDSEFSLDLTGFDAPMLDAVLAGGYTGPDSTQAGAGSGTEEQPDRTAGVYSGKIDAPVYEPTGPCPDVSELCVSEKVEQLEQEIEGANIPDDVKGFLKVAAARHREFDYEKIAEYYAHATKPVQQLMEKSALVIIDFNAAIENGFVKLSERMRELYVEENGSDN